MTMITEDILLYLSGFAKTWLQKSLLLSLVVEHVFHSYFFFFNRCRIAHSRETLMSFSPAINLLPNKMFFITSHNSLCMSV